MILEQNIKKYLSPRAQKLHLKIYECVGSTNTEIKKIADGKDEALVIASSQTAGRGRLGRSFFSPDGSGLYMSILLRPNHAPSTAALLTSAAAVAVSQAIERICNKKVDIKWINDIYIDSKKVCGILCESTFSNNSSEMEYIVVGIGINIFDPKVGFPEDIKNIAASVFGKSKPDEDIICQLCAYIVNGLLEYCDSLENRDFLEEYKKRSFVIGREINVIAPDATYTAFANDIDGDAHLIVTLPDGTQKALSYGEISIRPKS